MLVLTMLLVLCRVLLQLSSLAIFVAGMYGLRVARLDSLETRFQVSL